MPGHEISVVIGTLNRLDLLKRAVESIVRETRKSFHIYVADAGSTDGTVDYLRGLPSDRVTAILEGERRGQARSYNEVFRTVTSRYVCWLSDDNEVVNGGLDEAAAILDEVEELGMVALKVRDMQGPFVDAPYIGGVSSIGILNVNQGMLRTEVLHEVGGFSEDFRDYGIDPDLTTKVLLAGYDIAYTKCVALNHFRDWGPGPESPRFKEQMERQASYQSAYREKYRRVAAGEAAWYLKRAAWAIVRRLATPRFVNSSTSLLGAMPRDWQNAFCARYISLLDPLASAGRRYHLVQRSPRRVSRHSAKM